MSFEPYPLYNPRGYRQSLERQWVLVKECQQSLGSKYVAKLVWTGKSRPTPLDIQAELERSQWQAAFLWFFHDETHQQCTDMWNDNIDLKLTIQRWQVARAAGD